MESTKPSVAEALGQAHATLFEDLLLLEAAACSPARPVAELRVRLQAAHTHVTEHFRFEEEDGYMVAVKEREPRLERMVEQLSAEHRQLLNLLEVIIHEVQAAVCLEDPVADKVRTWIEQMRHHETRETDLVQEAFTLDIGSKD